MSDFIHKNQFEKCVCKPDEHCLHPLKDNRNKIVKNKINVWVKDRASLRRHGAALPGGARRAEEALQDRRADDGRLPGGGGEPPRHPRRGTPSGPMFLLTPS